MTLIKTTTLWYQEDTLLFCFVAHEELLMRATHLEHFPAQCRVPSGPGWLLWKLVMGRGGRAAVFTRTGLFMLCNKTFASLTPWKAHRGGGKKGFMLPERWQAKEVPCLRAQIKGWALNTPSIQIYGMFGKTDAEFAWMLLGRTRKAVGCPVPLVIYLEQGLLKKKVRFCVQSTSPECFLCLYDWHQHLININNIILATFQGKMLWSHLKEGKLRHRKI